MEIGVIKMGVRCSRAYNINPNLIKKSVYIKASGLIVRLNYYVFKLLPSVYLPIAGCYIEKVSLIRVKRLLIK